MSRRTRKPGRINDFPGPAYASQVLADSPAGYWRMNESPGSATMADSSGNGRDMTRTGTLTQGSNLHAGPYGEVSLDFDRTVGPGTEYLEIASATWMNNTSWTVEAIIEPDTVGADLQAVMSRETGTASTNRSWAVYTASEGVSVYNQTALWVSTGSLGMTANTVYHLCVVFPNASLAMVYLDGVFAGAATATATNTTVTAPLQIASATAAATAGASYWGFDGSISDAAYYDYALSSDRILAHATAAGLA